MSATTSETDEGEALLSGSPNHNHYDGIEVHHDDEEAADADEATAEEDPTTMRERFVTRIQEAAVDVKGFVVDELQEGLDQFMEELHQADDAEEDKNFIMEMGVARNLGMLPSDVADAAHLYQPPAQCTAPVSQTCQLFPEEIVMADFPFPQATAASDKQKNLELDEPSNKSENLDEPTKVKPDTAVSTDHHAPHSHTAPPIQAYFILGFAVMCLSSTGPFFNLQHNVDAVMKIFWRTSATNVILLPCAIHGIRTEGFPQLTGSQWIGVFLAGFAYSTLGIFFVMSLDYTSVGNAMVLNNSQALLLMLGKFFVGERVTRLEAIGASVAFCGAVACSLDAAKHENTTLEKSSRGLSLLGDFLALLSAFGGVGYLVFAQSVRSHINLYVFMFFNMFQNSLYALIFIVVSGRPFSITDGNPFHGLFAWIYPTWDRLFLTLVAVLLCNFFGVMGYIRMMHYFDKLVISVAGLMEPVVATMLAYGMGVGVLPGWLGWLGNALVACGTFVVVYKPSSEDVKTA